MNSRQRLVFAVNALAAVIVAMGGTALFSAIRLGAELNDSANVTSRKLILFGNAKSDILSSRLAIQSCLYGGQTEMAAERESREAQYREAIDRARRDLAELQPLLVTQKGKATIAALTQGVRQYDDAARDLLELSRQRGPAEANRLASGRLDPVGDRMVSEIQEFLKVQDAYVQQASERAVGSLFRAKAVAILLLLVGMGVSAAALWAIRRLNSALLAISSSLTAGATEVSAASDQLSSSSQRLAQGSSEQAAAIEEISSSLQEITATTNENVQSARKSADLMTEAQRTGATVRTAVDGMGSAVQEIHEANGQIARILRSIDEIAFQTNILALNAAVEAARAGEAGAGFAVVADEVRSLAQRCATAAKETAQFVERNGSSARSATERVDAVRATWAQSGSIRDQVKNLSDAIATSSAEQHRGVEEITKSVSLMNAATQQNAAQAQETASASQQLTAQARALRSVAGHLISLVGSPDAR